MLDQAAYEAVATELRSQLGKRQFLTVSRRDVTNILRRVANEPKTRVKSLVAQAITEALADQGLVFYPSLHDVLGMDNIRLFRSDSVLPELIELLNYPNEETDAKLRSALRGKVWQASETVESERQLEKVG